jgi:phosphatidylserine/phosphatidylglycerophosphate/cardiolipin synthase-like enzyme
MSAIPSNIRLPIAGFSLMLLLGFAVHDKFTFHPKVKPLPQDRNLQVFTNHNPSAQYRERDRPITREGDDLEQILIGEINQAKKSIDMAVQEIRLPRIAKALQEKQAKGVRVRVVLENLYRRPHSSYSEAEIQTLEDREQVRVREGLRLIDGDHNQDITPKEIAENDALVILSNANIPVIDDTADGSKGTGLMHHKFVVIDGKQVILTTANFTPSDIHGDLANSQSRGNANSLLNLKNAELAQSYSEEFNLLWGDGPGGKPDSLFGGNKPYRPAKTVRVGGHRVEVQFSPLSKTQPWSQSTNGLIAQHLSEVKHSLDFALFVFSDQGVVDAIAPLQSHTTIRGLIDAGFIFRPYSEALDMMGLSLGGDCKTGNRPWQTPLTTIGFPELPPGDLLHHKFAVLDKQKVIVGSHNWTEAANHNNDESILVIDHAGVAAHYGREFDRLYPTAHLGPSKHVKTQAQNPPVCQPKPRQVKRPDMGENP